MKKALSIFLAVLMLCACLTVGISAADEPLTYCSCEGCAAPAPCHCCLDCAEHYGRDYIMNCVSKDEDGNWVKCCDKCTGIWPNCGCDCECCKNDDFVIDDTKPILPEDVQNNITTVFQNILLRFRALFDSFFNAVFEFLRVFELNPKA